MSAASPGSLEAETPARLVMPKAANFACFVRFSAEKGGVGRVGARIAALDIVEAELIQHGSAMTFLSSTEKSMPGVCWPSRNVVSKR